MEEPHQIHLTYITERIITISCPPGCPDEIYLPNLQEIILMLQSKHGSNYMVRWVEQTAVTELISEVKVAIPQFRHSARNISNYYVEWPVSE